MSAITPAWDKQFEYLAVQPQRLSQWRKILRHWLLPLTASFCLNLVLLGLFPKLLEPNTSLPKLLPIEITLSPSKTQANIKTSPATSTPPESIKPIKPKPPLEAKPRIEQKIKPLPEPKPLPLVKAEPPPQAPVRLENTPVPSTESAITETTTSTTARHTPATSPPAEMAPPPLPKATPLYKLTRMPVFLAQQSAPYPESERALGREAKVLAEVFLDAQGEILQIRIIQSGGESFDQAVISSLQASRFRPGYVGSQAVAVKFQIPFAFQLH